MVKDRFKAKFILGNEEKEVTGWDAFDIINKIFDDIELAIEHAKAGEDENDFVISQMLYDWNYIDFDNPGDMHRFDRFNFEFSFGRYVCLEWSPTPQK